MSKLYYITVIFEAFEVSIFWFLTHAHRHQNHVLLNNNIKARKHSHTHIFIHRNILLSMCLNNKEPTQCVIQYYRSILCTCVWVLRYILYSAIDLQPKYTWTFSSSAYCMPLTSTFGPCVCVFFCLRLPKNLYIYRMYNKYSGY